jgi:hypothetical protein
VKKLSVGWKLWFGDAVKLISVSVVAPGVCTFTR